MSRPRLAVIAALACASALFLAASGEVVANTVGAWRSPRQSVARGTAASPESGTARPGGGATPITRPPAPGGASPTAPAPRSTDSPPPTPQPTGPPASAGAHTPTPTPSASTPLPRLKTMTGTSAIALTFDDGPTWTWTEQMLGVLRQAGVKATFCVIGKMARTYPERIREIVRAGHTLCNHSDNHDMSLGRRSEAEIRANLQAANDAIHAAAPDAKISYYRQPGGAWTPAVIKVATEMGMAPLHWDVDPRDWERPGAPAIYSRVTGHVRPGSIVLMHDGGGDRSGTVAAVRQLLPVLKARFSLIPLPPRRSP